MPTKKRAEPVANKPGLNISEERRKILDQMGPADPATLRYRKKLRTIGVAVEFHKGMTQKEALRILGSPGTKALLKNHAV